MNAPDKLSQFIRLTREPLPSSRKIYVPGSRPDIAVPLREIKQPHHRRALPPFGIVRNQFLRLFCVFRAPGEAAPTRAQVRRIGFEVTISH